MVVKVAPAEDGDMYRLMEICDLAFVRNEPIFDCFWPNHWSEEGRQAGAERFRLLHKTDPTTTYLKAYEDSTGEILGMAKWNVFFQNQLPDESKVQGGDGDYWATEEDRALVKRLDKAFGVDRRAAIARTEGNVVSLDILAVDPKHQRKNVGGALVKWGIDKADELGIETVVESSVFGKGLYLKNGFVFQKDVILEVEGYNGPDFAYAWLVRPKKGSA